MRLIRPWLYVGKLTETQNPGWLWARGIGAMLQLAGAVPQPGIESLYVDVEDGESLPPDALQQGMDFVRAQHALGKIVLIACGAGISRSATFAIAALKEIEDLPLLDAWRLVKANHPDALPHPALWESLCHYYDEDIPLTAFLAAIRAGG